MAVFPLREDDFFKSQLASFRELLKSDGRSWDRGLREAAFARFSELGLPTVKDEEWKYTSLAPLAGRGFRRAAGGGRLVSGRELAALGLAWLAEQRAVCVDGRFVPELSFLEKLPPGVRVGSLGEAMRGAPEPLRAHFGRHADYQGHSFVALNTALAEDGVYVHVPKRTALSQPLHLVFVSTAGGEPTVSYPRVLVVIEEESEATILESYLALGPGVYLASAVGEVVVGNAARLDHTTLVRQGSRAFHVGVLQVEQARQSAFSSHLVSIGGSLVRNEIGVRLAGEGAECSLDGLFVATGREHVDNRTRIDHVEPHGTSRELYKGVLGGASRGIFNGTICVHQGAARTDAEQTNKNLLLSGEATVDSKPRLEIHNNDVRCRHGSTIGRLDAESLFYLRSRGLEADEARRLLTFAFASEVVARLKIERLKLQLENWLLARLEAPRQAEEAR
jgi:Fe-S cluster assembly protein SufD